MMNAFETKRKICLMHMRKKKNREPRLERVKQYFVSRTENGSVNLEESFSEAGDLYLEIGCGKGTFATELSRKGENANILAVELNTDAILMAMEKCAAEDCRRLKFLNANAEKLPELLPAGSVSRLYLNFSDPWPRNRDRDRRLTSVKFLNVYKKILAKDARIIFKTDNRPLFDFSVKSFPEAGFVLEAVSYDLHASEWNEGNIVTEYEKKWSDKGYPIHYLKAYLGEQNNPEQSDVH